MTDTAKLFLTDYASYNEGTQFEFGHWVDLDQFADAEDFSDYICKHFKQCDSKSPLYGGCPREETMFTDFEGFPSELYSESMCANEMENLFTYINLDERERINVTILLEQGYDMAEALDRYEDINPIEYTYTYAERYDLAEMYYPEAEAATEICDYVRFDYDRFIDQEFTEFTVDGIHYLVHDSEL